MIKYANGTKEVIRSETVAPTVHQTPVNNQRARADYLRNRKVHPLAVASLVLGAGSAVVGYALLIFAFEVGFPIVLFVIPCLLGIGAFVSGQVAFKDIRAHPDQWKGKGLAGPGSIIGIVIAAISLMVLFIAAALGAL